MQRLLYVELKHPSTRGQNQLVGVHMVQLMRRFAVYSLILASNLWRSSVDSATHVMVDYAGKAYSWSLNSEYSSSCTFTGLPPYYRPSISRLRLQIWSNEERTCGIRTLSPGATLGAIRFPSLSNPPGPTASTVASLSSLRLLSGK